MTDPTTTIKVIKPDGTITDKEVAVLVAYTNSPLAITEAEETRGAIVITHLPTGKRLGPAIDLSAISDLTQLLDQLAALPWDDDSLTPNDLRWDAVNIISDWQRE